jgi:hypothetical protein
MAGVLSGVQAQAGTIPQTVGYFYGAEFSQPDVYSQLNPALGPLNAVLITATIDPNGFGATYRLTNRTANTINFNATLGGSVVTDAGITPTLSNTVPVTLGPNQSTILTPYHVPQTRYELSSAETSASAYNHRFRS